MPSGAVHPNSARLAKRNIVMKHGVGPWVPDLRSLALARPGHVSPGPTTRTPLPLRGARERAEITVLTSTPNRYGLTSSFARSTIGFGVA